MNEIFEGEDGKFYFKVEGGLFYGPFETRMLAEHAYNEKKMFMEFGERPISRMLLG